MDSHSTVDRPLRRLASGGGVGVRGGGWVLAAFHTERLLYLLNKDALFRLVAWKNKHTHTHKQPQPVQTGSLYQGKSGGAQLLSAGGLHLHGHVISSPGNGYDVDCTSHNTGSGGGNNKVYVMRMLPCHQARQAWLRITSFSILWRSH